MDKKVIVIVFAAIVIALLFLVTWQSTRLEISAEEAQELAKSTFEEKWSGVADGCGFDRFGDGEKTAFGYEVTVIGKCGFVMPGQEPAETEEKYFVSNFGTVKEIEKPVPPSKPPVGPAAEKINGIKVIEGEGYFCGLIGSRFNILDQIISDEFISCSFEIAKIQPTKWGTYENLLVSKPVNYICTSDVYTQTDLEGRQEDLESRNKSSSLR